MKTSPTQTSRRRIVAWAVGAIAASAAPRLVRAAAPPVRVDVWKSPSCGCCGAWVDHLRAAGFQVNVMLSGDLPAARKAVGMPDAYASCHTARVDGYALEGHVPARDILRLLKERPKAVGLSVPGMPVGSPGMEQGPRKDPYDVLLVNAQGGSTVFSSYR